MGIQRKGQYYYITVHLVRIEMQPSFFPCIQRLSSIVTSPVKITLFILLGCAITNLIEEKRAYYHYKYYLQSDVLETTSIRSLQTSIDQAGERHGVGWAIKENVYKQKSGYNYRKWE